MNSPAPLKFHLDRELFFKIGRALQRGIGKGMLGLVNLSIEDGHLLIDSDWGGGRIACRGHGSVSVQLRAKAFCSLITTRFREKSPTGEMEIVFTRGLKEVSIDRAGVKAKFL